MEKNTSSDSVVQAGKMQSQNMDSSNLSAGKIFKGEILDIKGSQVSIGLENGQVFQARLEADVNLSIGQKLMFEVKSNNGVHMEIKPAQTLSNPNPVLQKALQEANIPITDRNMEMVSNMLKEGLSIDKQSLSNMLKQFNINPNADAQTIVKMNKLGIEATKENVAQFENYKNYEHRIVKDIDHIASNLTKLLGEMSGEDKNASLQLNNKLIEILNNNYVINSKENSENPTITIPLNQNSSQYTNSTSQFIRNIADEQLQTLDKQQTSQMLQEELNQTSGKSQIDSNISNQDNINNLINENGKLDSENSIVRNDNQIIDENVDRNHMLHKKMDTNLTNMINTDLNPSEAKGNQLSNQNEVNNQNQISNEEQINKANNQGQLLENILTNEERSNLTQMLKNLGADTHLLNQVKEGKLDSKELLNMVKTLLANPENALKAQDLFASKEYAEILKQEIRNQWLVEPEHLNEPDKMSNLYKQMDEQTKQIATLLETIGKENSSIFKDVSNVRSNLNFMEQINQNFTYLQIPIQFSNEEAHSDLYVYTKKKNLKNNDGNLSVLLHLDMEVLGTTDVYIKMSGNQVSAKFSLENNEAIELVEDNLESLIKRLENKGYRTNAQVGSLEKEQDFVEDFLEQDKVVTSLKRYAFDVRT
jgi:hypothetical protein